MNDECKTAGSLSCIHHSSCIVHHFSGGFPMTPPAIFSTYLDAARAAALLGAAALEEWRTRFRVQEKARFDLVTDADLASQKAIFDFLGGLFPDHVLLGEEDKEHHCPGPDAPPTWIVDP